MKPPRPDSPQAQEEALTRELKAIRLELQRLNTHRFVRQMNSPVWMLGATFTRGIVLGLGTVFGATLVVSVLVFILTHVNWVPILGHWAAMIAEEIQSN